MLAEGILLERFFDYDDFHYDAEQMGYVGEVDGSTHVVKFDSAGRLVACIRYDVPPDGEDYVETPEGYLMTQKQIVTRFYTYEAKNITLPTV